MSRIEQSDFCLQGLRELDLHVHQTLDGMSLPEIIDFKTFEFTLLTDPNVLLAWQPLPSGVLQVLEVWCCWWTLGGSQGVRGARSGSAQQFLLAWAQDGQIRGSAEQESHMRPD